MQSDNTKFEIQGIKLSDLAKEYGTPLYIYDADKITSQIKTLKQAFSGLKLRIKYAAKALSNVSILKVVRKEGGQLDVVSIQEGLLGMMAGFKPEEIFFTPSGVDFEEIKEAHRLGFFINLDSIFALENFGKEFGQTVPCSVRLNPHILAGGNLKISTGHSNSKFGISYMQVDEIIKVVKKYHIKVEGLHIHTGSDILDSEVFVKGAEFLFDMAKNFPDLRFLDLGSGFKVAYKEGDKTTDMQEVGAKLTAAFQKFNKSYGREIELWFEPGKFIVSESGSFVVKANVVKENPSVTFVGVDSGLNHLIRPMMYDAYHEIVNISNPSGAEKLYTVVGYICETDTFGTARMLQEVRPGDLLLLKNAGAYGFSMSSNYNSRFRPAEILVYNGKAHLIRKRETFEDLTRNLVDVDI